MNCVCLRNFRVFFQGDAAITYTQKIVLRSHILGEVLSNSQSEEREKLQQFRSGKRFNCGKHRRRKLERI